MILQSNRCVYRSDNTQFTNLENQASLPGATAVLPQNPKEEIAITPPSTPSASYSLKQAARQWMPASQPQFVYGASYAAKQLRYKDIRLSTLQGGPSLGLEIMAGIRSRQNGLWRGGIYVAAGYYNLSTGKKERPADQYEFQEMRGAVKFEAELRLPLDRQGKARLVLLGGIAPVAGTFIVPGAVTHTGCNPPRHQGGACEEMTVVQKGGLPTNEGRHADANGPQTLLQPFVGIKEYVGIGVELRDTVGLRVQYGRENLWLTRKDKTEYQGQEGLVTLTVAIDDRSAPRRSNTWRTVRPYPQRPLPSS